MSVSLNDIVLQTDDLLSNYNVTTVDKGNVYRAINRSIEYVQRKLGLPSDKKIHSFYYYEDTPFYTAPNGFNELLQVYYNNSSLIDVNHNYQKNRWYVFKDIEMLRTSAPIQVRNKVAWTTINQLSQLYLLGSNLYGMSTINSFDSTTGLTFSSNISNTSIDTDVKKQGSGSLKFDMSNALTSTTISFTGVWDMSAIFTFLAAHRLYLNLPTGAAAQLSSLSLQFQSSTGNFYELSTTTQDTGEAFTENVWDRVSFSTASYTTTGSPNSKLINKITLTFYHSGSFTGITGMRIDDLYQIIPDYLDAVYYSAYKGTDVTGDTPKILLTTASDIVSFGDYAPDLIMPIALKAATILNPQLRADKDFASLYKSEFTDHITLMSRTYPRQRQAGNAQTQLIR